MPQVDQDLRDKVCALYQAGSSYRDIADKLPICKSTAGNIVRAAGLSRTLSEAMSGESNPRWNGGRVVHDKGYIQVLLPGHPRANSHGYVYEHIVVAQEKIGRPLKDNEQVHHIDRDRANNTPENLRVLTATEHKELHDSEGDVHEGQAAIQRWLWEQTGGGEWAEQQRQREQMREPEDVLPGFEARDVTGDSVPF